MFYKLGIRALTILFLFLTIHFLPGNVFAAEKFSTDYNIRYVINENTNTRVNLKVSLQNKTSDYYASSYRINVGMKNIKNIEASDPDGQIKPNIIPGENGT